MSDKDWLDELEERQYWDGYDKDNFHEFFVTVTKAERDRLIAIARAAEALCADPWDNERRDRLRAALRGEKP